MWRRLIYHPEINYGLRQTIILCLPIAIALALNDLRSGLLFSLVPACCNIAGLDTPHRHFFKRFIIGGVLFSSSAFLTLEGIRLGIPLPLILLALALLFGVVNEISPLHARLLPASLIAAIFSLNLPNSMPSWYPVALCLSGVIWYGAFTYFWLWLWKDQPVRELLGSLYKQLADYFETKYAFLIQSSDDTTALPELLKKQQSVMDTEALIYQQLQMMRGMHKYQYKKLLRAFQVALDLQEHISVRWNQTEQAKTLIAQSQVDILLKHCVKAIAQRLRNVADDIQYHRKSDSFSMRNETIALEKIAQQYPDHDIGSYFVYQFTRISRLLRSLVPLYNRNLMPEPPRVPFWRSAINYLSFKSPALRSAARLGVTLAIGSLFGMTFNLPKPFWILLTIMLVSQNGYNATRIRIQHRALGTLIGLVMTSWILNLSFSQNVMLLIMLLITLMSYLIVRKNYGIAVIGFTITAVYTLQLITHDGSDFLVARMIDTVIGCILALASSVWLWPQWQSGTLRNNAQKILEADRTHLRLLLSGADDNGHNNELSYSCIKLNQAHNTLVATLNQAMQEPGFNSQYLTEMRLWVSHSQVIVEHLNAITMLAHDSYSIAANMANQYLVESELAIQNCQQRLKYDRPQEQKDKIESAISDVAPANIMAYHLNQIIHHINMMGAISATAWTQHRHRKVWFTFGKKRLKS